MCIRDRCNSDNGLRQGDAISNVRVISEWRKREFRLTAALHNLQAVVSEFIFYAVSKVQRPATGLLSHDLRQMLEHAYDHWVASTVVKIGQVYFALVGQKIDAHIALSVYMFFCNRQQNLIFNFFVVAGVDVGIVVRDEVASAGFFQMIGVVD